MEQKYKIAILGYGRMGKMVEAALLEMGHVVSVTIDNEKEWAEKYEVFLSSDVAVEFSTPETAIGNFYHCFEAGIPLVAGTTGWSKQLPEILNKARQHSASFVYGSNFSVGANLFLMLNKIAAELMNNQYQYDVHIEETHHIHKKDAPSGTAITIAELIMSQLKRKTEWTMSPNPEPGQIQIIAHREGDTTGIHQVTYESPEDTIQIIHNAHDRTGFAHGAVKAALWLVNNHGIYEFKDIFPQLLK